MTFLPTLRQNNKGRGAERQDLGDVKAPAAPLLPHQLLPQAAADQHEDTDSEQQRRDLKEVDEEQANSSFEEQVGVDRQNARAGLVNMGIGTFPRSVLLLVNSLTMSHTCNMLLILFFP